MSGIFTEPSTPIRYGFILLKDSGQRGMIQATNGEYVRYSTWQSLQKERDALLEALKECVDAMDGTAFAAMKPSQVVPFAKAMDRAQEAIARATTGTTEKP